MGVKKDILIRVGFVYVFMLVLAFVGTFNPPIGIILGILGVVAGKLVGLVAITISSIMGIVILGILFATRMKGEG